MDVNVIVQILLGGVGGITTRPGGLGGIDGFDGLGALISRMSS